MLSFGCKLTELMIIDKTQVNFENQHDQAIFSKVMLFFLFFFPFQYTVPAKGLTLMYAHLLVIQ